MLHYGKGDLTGFRVDPDVTLDIVSGDCPLRLVLPFVQKLQLGSLM